MYVIINWYNIVVVIIIGCSPVSSGSQVVSNWDPLSAKTLLIKVKKKKKKKKRKEKKKSEGLGQNNTKYNGEVICIWGN